MPGLPRPTITIALLIALPMFGGCAEESPNTDDEHTVALEDNRFVTDDLGTVLVGGTVGFHNAGRLQHTVTIGAGTQELHDVELRPGQATSFLFDEAGSYIVYCRIHGTPDSGMRFTFQVEA